MLALGTPDFDDANHISAQFQQRGIEGVIAIEAVVPTHMELPVASVELDYASSAETLSEDAHLRLAALGESAAETIIRQIENESASRRMNVGPKLPAAIFNLPVPALSIAVDARERA